MIKDHIYYTRKAIAYHQKLEFDKALIGYDLAIAQKPDFAPAVGNRAEIYYRKGRWDESRRDFELALKLSPNIASGWYNYSLLLLWACEHDLALEAVNKAIHLDNKIGSFYHNKGNIYREMGDRDAEAMAAYNEAVRLDPLNYSAKTGRAWINLRQGKWAEGLPEFEDRLRAYPDICPGFKQPMWDGSPLDGRRLIVVGEQGAGDNIMCARFLPILARQGDVSLVIWERMAPMMENLGVPVMYGRHVVSPPFVWAPIMSLMHLMKLTVDTVLWHGPYMQARPDRVDKWHHKLRGKEGKRIGICWTAGHPNLNGFRSRDIPLEEFKPFADAGHRLIVLQKGPGVGQIGTQSFPVEYYDHDPEKETNNFLDTQGIMANLDLVVSTDTSVVHMAGAMGVRVFMPKPPGTCWRWLENRTDSPWYPSLKLFPQSRHRYWKDVFEQMVREI